MPWRGLFKEDVIFLIIIGFLPSSVISSSCPHNTSSISIKSYLCMTSSFWSVFSFFCDISEILFPSSFLRHVFKQVLTGYGSDLLPSKRLPACLPTCWLAYLLACLLACLFTRPRTLLNLDTYHTEPSWSWNLYNAAETLLEPFWAPYYLLHKVHGWIQGWSEWWR